jgi:cleavage and polyadenylation specificity factor subunit 4
LTLLTDIGQDEQICRDALSNEGCPRGPTNCPLRHTVPSSLNFKPQVGNAGYGRDRERQMTVSLLTKFNLRMKLITARIAKVCKHWLRGLCKKGDACEFLHEYNLRRMPECWWFAKYGYCASGEECLYIHPKERKGECPDYKRGFCKLGMHDVPRC